MTPVDIRDLAWGLFPNEEGERFLALLWAYFDESGTDGTGGHTVISGFISPIEGWNALKRPWEEELKRAGVDWFHYVDCRGRNKHYRHFKNRDDVGLHLEILSQIIEELPLEGVSVSFSGDWGKVKKVANLGERFPTAYSFCFELCMFKLVEIATLRPNSQIAVVFARQEQYANRALGIYDMFKYNNLWPEIVHCGYSDARALYQLQAADMIAWEYRRILASFEDNDAWKLLPLHSKLVRKHHKLGVTLHAKGLDAKAAIEFLSTDPDWTLFVPPWRNDEF